MTDAMHLPVDQLATRCRKESSRSGHRPPDELSSCWELFRRAIVEDDQQAWQALYVQYRWLVVKWSTGADLDADDVVTETFARFWEAVRNRDFVARFPTMKRVMAYLKRCARTLAIDAARRREHQQLVREALSARAKVIGHDSPGETAEEQVSVQELKAHLDSRLRDEDERLVFWLSYDTGLKPREIAAQHPQRFADARAVSRIKGRIWERLNEHPTLNRWRPW